MLPCSMCNEMIESDLNVDHFYHAVPTEEIECAIFDYQELLREALLIELPQTVECNDGNCPERAKIAPYMRSSSETNFPFKDIDDDQES